MADNMMFMFFGWTNVRHVSIDVSHVLVYMLTVKKASAAQKQ